MAPPPELGRGVKWEHTTHLAPGAAMRSPFEAVAAARRHPSKHALGALLRTLARSLAPRTLLAVATIAYWTAIASWRMYWTFVGPSILACVRACEHPHTSVSARTERRLLGIPLVDAARHQRRSRPHAECGSRSTDSLPSMIAPTY